MTIEEKSVDIKNKFNDILNDVKSKLKKEIVDNPKFDTLFLKELNFIYRKTVNLDFDVDVALDNNYVLLSTNNPIRDLSLGDFRDNIRSYIQTRFFLSDNDLCVEYNQGVLIDRKDLEKKGYKILLQYETKLETYYSVSYYNPSGVEVSNNSYIDSFPLTEEIDDVSLKEVLLSSFYKPIFYKNTLATMPIHVLEASVKNIYRKDGSYSIIHSNIANATKDGYKDLRCYLLTSHPEFPDLLRGEKIIAKSVDKEGKIIFNPEKEYAETLDEAYKKASNEFKEKIKDKDINKDTLDCLMKNI